MSRLILALLLTAATASPVRAHFVFVVPEPSGAVAYVILSEDLDPDGEVGVGLLGGLQLSLRGADGADSPLTLLPDEAAFRVEFSATDARLIHGALQLGVHQVGERPGNLVSYYPKAILGDAFGPAALVGGDQPVELVPVGRAGDLRLQLLLRGEPLAGAEVTVFLPDGGRTQVLTDASGLTGSFAQLGRYGAWARATVGGAGQHDGQDYAEARGYASLVAQVGDDSRPLAERSPTEQGAPSEGFDVRPFARLPEPTSSFGAVEAGGFLYVYGGHTARTHDYDTEAVSGRFARLALDGGRVWERLPGGPALQGMNLAAHGDVVYRVGGMQPRNPRGSQVDNHSLADCTRFNPQTQQWEWLTPLPEARSSHDVAVIGDRLYVVGGWNMLGELDGNVWPEDMLTLDLSDPRAAWKRVAQPFARRALIAAVLDGRLYVMGGMDEEDEVSRRVDIFDPATGIWSRGPELLGDHTVAGFASAACVLDGRLYASVAGGELLRLSADGDAWESVARHTPRIVHRLVPWDGQILVAGGAADGSNSDLVEALTPPGRSFSRRVPGGQAASPAARAVVRPVLDDAGVPAVPAVAAMAADPAVAGVPAASERAPSEPAVATSDVSAAPPATAAQVHCPVMTNVEVLGDDDAIAVEYDGRQVLLCCSKCVRKWEQDPAAYLSTETLPQLAGLALPERGLVQVYCPVYPTRVISERDPFVLYQGQKVYLFNKTAVRRFNEDPERYVDLAILPQLAE